MTELLFIPIIGLLGLVSTIVSSKGALFDKRYKWYKRLTQRGQIVTLIGVIIVGLSIWQYIFVKRTEDQREYLQSKQRKTSDSTIAIEIKKGVDSSRRQLFNDLSEALGNQNLRLDTVTKQIEILRDSPKTVILNSEIQSPIILVRQNGVTYTKRNDTTEFKLDLLSTQAAAKLLSLNMLCEIIYKDGIKETLLINKLIDGPLLIPKEQPLSQPFLMTVREVDFINIALIGEYTPMENNRRIKLNDVYTYSLNKKEVTFFFPAKRDSFFKHYNLK